MNLTVKSLGHILGCAVLATAMSASAAQAQSITQALTLAYEHSPDLQSAVLSARSAAEGIALAKAGQRPTIGASLAGNQSWDLNGGSWHDSTSLTSGLSYKQTIYDSGRSDAQIEVARAATEAAEHQIRSSEQIVLFSVIQAYMAVYADRQLLDLRGESLAFFQAQVTSAEDRLAVGEGTRIDVAQAQARLAQGQAAHRAAQGSLDISQARFMRQVGAAPQNLATTHDYARLIPASLQSAMAEAELGHPAILAAKAGIRAAQASIQSVSAGFGATAAINGSVGTRWSGPGGGAGDGLNGAIGFQISVPIYAGGSIGAGVRKANIEQIKSEVDAMSVYDQIREAVISAWASIQSADAQIAAAATAASAGQTVLDSVVQERDLGSRTTLDVLNAQAELVTSREAVINASANKVVATFSLLSAMGRLTASDLGLAVVTKSATGYAAAVEDVWQELRAVAE
ncbi:TolC family outer membrane protein [Devosia sp. A369]